MHDSKFPESSEAPERRTDRALEALQYEERAGLGFRRRQRAPIGDPNLEPERYQVDREPSLGELWAGYLAGFGAILGFGALLYKPLLFGTLAVFLGIFGSLGDGAPSRIARIGLTVTIICFTLGMLLAMFVTHKPIW
jgi:hypothetical protein